MILQSQPSISKATNMHWMRVARQLKQVSHCWKVKKTLRQMTNDITSALRQSHQCHSHQSQLQASSKEETNNVQRLIPIKQEIRIVRDQEVLGSEFANYLVPLTVDNDVESGPEETDKGIGLLYGELLYSLGEEMVAKRRRKDKKLKKKKLQGENKQNWDCNQQTTKRSLEKRTIGENQSRRIVTF